MDKLLPLIKSNKNDLSANSIYQVLIGRRTTTTLFFSVKNHLSHYHGLYPQLSKASWFQYWESDTVQQPVLNKSKQYYFKQRIGIIPRQQHQLWFTSFALLLQTLSYARIKETSYIPMTASIDAQNFIKFFYQYMEQHFKLDKIALGNKIKKECKTYFENESKLMTDLFINQFADKEGTALTIDQLLFFYDGEGMELRVLLQSYFDNMLTDFIDTDSMLGVFFKQLIQYYPPWNRSTAITWELFNEGFTLEQISQKRHLKASTINDHLMEVMLYRPSIFFPYFEKLVKIPLDELADVSRPQRFNIFKEQFGAELPFWTFRLWQYMTSKGRQPLKGGWDD